MFTSSNTEFQNSKFHNSKCIQFKMFTIQNVHNFNCRILKLKIPNVQMFQISMFTIQRADPNKCQRSKCSNVVMFSFLFRTKKTRKQLKTLKHTKTINWIAFSPFLHCSLELVEAALRELVRLRKVFFIYIRVCWDCQIVRWSSPYMVCKWFENCQKKSRIKSTKMLFLWIKY